MTFFTRHEKNIIIVLTLLLVSGFIIKIIKEKVFPDSSETLKLIAVSEEIKSNYSNIPVENSQSDSSLDLININESDINSLVALPGVGPILAEKIIRTREKLNGFKSIEQLLDVPGIGEKKFNNIRSKVTL